jgi:hypothetical protein
MSQMGPIIKDHRPKIIAVGGSPRTATGTVAGYLPRAAARGY